MQMLAMVLSIVLKEMLSKLNIRTNADLLVAFPTPESFLRAFAAQCIQSAKETEMADSGLETEPNVTVH